MPRKTPVLFPFLHLVLRPLTGQASAISSSPESLPTDRQAWRLHWQAKGQPWRTEPEIDQERQQYLAEHRAIVPDIEKGIYPCKDIQLTRADIEWLLPTHENSRGPLDWPNESQRHREGLDLRGTNLVRANLQSLPLSRMRGGLSVQEWDRATAPQREMAAIHLEGADLQYGLLQEAFLRGRTFGGGNPSLDPFRRGWIRRSTFGGC